MALSIFTGHAASTHPANSQHARRIMAMRYGWLSVMLSDRHRRAETRPTQWHCAHDAKYWLAGSHGIRRNNGDDV